MSIVIKAPSGGGSISIDTQQSVTGNHTLQLPTGVGSANQILRNGSTAGTLEFGSLVSSNMPTGSILQVRGTYVDTTDSQAITAGTRAEISGLSVSITPTTLTSNMLIFVRWNGEYNSNNNYDAIYGLRRDSTDLGHQPSVGTNRAAGMQVAAQGFYTNNADSTCDSANWFYLDEEDRTSSGQITYKATYMHGAVNGTLFNQRTVGDIDGATRERPTSSIVVMEVAA